MPGSVIAHSRALLDEGSQVPLNGTLCNLDPMEIGQKIRLARLQRGLSLQALGNLVGVSRSAVHQWETGQVTNITVDHRIKLGEALGMPISDLLPPHATAGEVTIRNPQAILLQEIFDSMSLRQREAYLRLLLVMRDEGQAP